MMSIENSIKTCWISV